jgi:hypothetical protein
MLAEPVPCRLFFRNRAAGKNAMKWVTRDHLHLDRVASPWLIRRFIDPAAEFAFVPFGEKVAPPADAIAFGIPGVELGSHDANGSTFRKLLRKYELTDPALEMLCGIIESGIVHVFSQIDHGHTDVAALKFPEGIGLDALSQGMMYASSGDLDNIEKSLVLYDALYAFCRAKLIERARPDLAKLPPPKQWDAIRAELARAELAKSR